MDGTPRWTARAAPVACLAVILVVAGCASRSVSAEEESGDEFGEISISYGAVAEDQADLAELVRESESLEDTADYVAYVAELPADLRVDVRTCDEDDETTWYDGENGEVLICMNELLDAHEQVVENDYSEDVDETMVDMADAYLLHELGHAVIDLRELAITGREEDVADQFVAWMALEWLDEPNIVLEAANEYYVTAHQYEHSDDDVHGTPGQRTANFLCWLYGFDPEEWGHLVDDDPLTALRAEECEVEWEEIVEAWESLLGVTPAE